MCDRDGFFGKNPHRAKMTKNSIKTGFLDFEENHVISFV